MQEQLTCGQGLAHNAVLPSHLAEVASGMAAVLEHHMTALPADDPEFAAYNQIAEQHRAAAASLAEAARLMTAARNLPIAPHDMTIMTSPAAGETFADLVAAKRRLATLLHTQDAEDQQFLEP